MSKSKRKKVEFVTKERLIELHSKKTPSEGFIYLYQTDTSLTYRIRQCAVVKFDSNVSMPIPYMGQEAIMATLLKYDTIYIASEFVKITNNQKRNPIANAIIAYARTMNGVCLNKSLNAAQEGDYTRMTYNQGLYSALITMHKRMTDKDYVAVKRFVEHKDIYENESLDHVVTMYDHKANEHNFICRETRRNIDREIAKACVIDYSVSRLCIKEKTAFEELPYYDAPTFRHFLNCVKPFRKDKVKLIFDEK